MQIIGAAALFVNARHHLWHLKKAGGSGVVWLPAMRYSEKPHGAPTASQTDFSRAELPSMRAPVKLRTSGGREGWSIRSRIIDTAASLIRRTG